MKQHDINNDFCKQDKSDDALYQQMLAELAPGAEEYDKLIAEGKHPATKMHRTIPYYKYVAAACVLFAVVGGTWFWQTNGETEPQTQLVAQVEEKKQEASIDYYQVQKDTETEETTTPPDIQKQVRPNKHHASRPILATQTAQLAEDSINTPADIPNQELYHALLAEVEGRMVQARLQEEYLHRAVIEEVYTYIIENPDGPQLTL